MHEHHLNHECTDHHCSAVEAEIDHRVTTDPEKYAELIPARDRVHDSGPGRRGFLGAGLAGLAGVGSLAAAQSPAAASAPGPEEGTGEADGSSRGLKVVLLGTKAGPAPATDRKGISSALVVDGHTYVIDCGRSSLTQFMEAGLDLSSIKGIFLTHLHADHVSDYFHYFMLASPPGKKDEDQMPAMTPVYGPGPAGGLAPPSGDEPVPTAGGTDPTPGTLAMTNYLLHAFAYSNNVFMRGFNWPDYESLMTVHELMPPAGVGAGPLNRAPGMAPFTVMEDERVRVTATLVPHGPVFPAFAFRFDTEYGSVTFSGDTTHTPNLIHLAQDSDLLVHEALQIPPQAELSDHVLEQQLKLHVLVEHVGGVAQAASARQLVLSHVENVAGDIDVAEWTRLASRGYDGEVAVGEDLQVIRIA